ncbi:reverse transcriptase domain-containing protein [Tanacetum coccineum]
MSDSEHSTVTYTSVSIPVEDDSDMGSPGVDGPPSPDYVPGPEEPEQAPPSSVYLPYVPDPVYPPRDPEKDAKEDPEEDPTNYPADRQDDDDENDDDDDDDEEDEEEEEHVALADYTVVALPTVDHVPSEEETKPFKTDECAATPPSPPSPLIPYSSPLPQIPSPPPNSPTHIEVPESCLPLRKRLRFAAPTPNHEVGESSAAGAARQDGPAVAREDPYSVARGDLYGFVDRVDVAPGRPMSRELDYGITDTWDDLVGAIEEIAPTTLEGVNQRVTNLSTTVEQETTIMYGMMEDAQDDRSLLRARVKLLYRDRPVHRRLAVMIEREARMAREAWGLSMDASDYARSDVMSLRTTIVGQRALISELQSADHRRQGTQMAEFQRQHGPAKGPAQPDAPGEAARNATGIAMIAILQDSGLPEGPVLIVGLTQWFEKMESVYSISNCTVACQVKFATCTLQGNALTWWNSHVKTTTPEAAHAMPWRTLKKMMTDKYCPRGEIKKLEFEMWNLKVKGTDVVTYSQRFQELALMCDRMFPEEIDKVEKYVGGLPDMIHGSVMATKPKTMQDAIEFGH